MNKGQIPLFVSEGESRQKVAAIRSHPYLSFALQSFANAQAGLTVYGSSLGESDGHWLHYLDRNHHLRTIAVSVRTAGRSDDDLEDVMETYRRRLGTLKELQFFSAETCPFYYRPLLQP